MGNLAIATGCLAGGILVALFFALYEILTHYGLEPFAAQAATIVLALTMLLLLTCTLSYRLQRLKHMPKHIIATELPLAGTVNRVADSFLNGPLGEDRPGNASHFHP